MIWAVKMQEDTQDKIKVTVITLECNKLALWIHLHSFGFKLTALATILTLWSHKLIKNTQIYTDTHTHPPRLNILTGGFSIIQANCIVMGYSTFMNSGYLENELIIRQMKDFNYSPPTHICTNTHTSDFSSTWSFLFEHTLTQFTHTHRHPSTPPPHRGHNASIGM